MVKIVGLGSPPLPQARPVGRSSAAGRFRVGPGSAVEEGRNAAPVEGVSIAPSLLAIQESLEAAERDARAMKRAEAMLEELGALQLGLLAGRLSESRLAALKRLVSEAEAAADPRLAEIALEVEVRAAVELARLERAAGRGA
ncbi:MAG: flagellar assembly protein FliX [Acetobacteraceae bacterium]|nr:flagellar assembly protein FliX [Acetobacteraceae bacterium]